MPTDKTVLTDKTHARVVAMRNIDNFAVVKSVKSVLSAGGINGEATAAARPQKLETLPSSSPPSRVDGDVFRHGRSVTGQPRLWTGRIVSLDEWHKLTAWELHGPDGRMFCGACRVWVLPDACPHGGGGAA